MKIDVTQTISKDVTIDVEPVAIMEQIAHELIYKILATDQRHPFGEEFSFRDNMVCISYYDMYQNRHERKLELLPNELEKIKAVLKTLELVKEMF